MKINLYQVRQALINIAKERNRPEFGKIVADDVLRAIRDNLHHNLKEIVMKEIYNLYGHLYAEPEEDKVEIDQNAIMEKLSIIRSYYAGQKVLVSRSGVSERTISLILTSDHQVSYRVYEKLNPVLDSVIEELKRHKIEKDKNSHGTYVNYRKGCRCDHCKEAWREYIKDRNRRKKAQEIEAKLNNQKITRLK